MLCKAVPVVKVVAEQLVWLSGCKPAAAAYCCCTAAVPPWPADPDASYFDTTNEMCFHIHWSIQDSRLKSRKFHEIHEYVAGAQPSVRGHHHSQAGRVERTRQFRGRDVQTDFLHDIHVANETGRPSACIQDLGRVGAQDEFQPVAEPARTDCPSPVRTLPVAPLWCHWDSSRIVVVIKLRRTSALC